MGITQLISRRVGASDIAFGTGSFSWVDENGISHTTKEVDATMIPTSGGRLVDTCVGCWTVLRPGTELATLIASFGTTQATIYICVGDHEITVNTTVPKNITLRPEYGALLYLNNVTLTINGHMDAGMQPLFVCTGTGAVVFGPWSVAFVIPDWWATNTVPGTTDMAPAMQAAMIAAKSTAVNNPMTVLLGPTTYNLASEVDFYRWARLKGNGCQSTIITSTANITLFGAAEDLYITTPASERGFYSLMEDLTIDVSANLNAVTVCHFKHSVVSRGFHNVAFIGRSASNQGALHFDNDGSAHLWYYNRIHGCDFSGFQSTNGVIFLEGSTTLSARDNENWIYHNAFTDYKTAIKVIGIGNTIRENEFGNRDLIAASDPVKIAGGGQYYCIDVSGGYVNKVSGNWFEQATADVIVRSVAAKGQNAPAVEAYNNVGIAYRNQIADMCDDVDSYFVATHTGAMAADTFTVAGDQTADIVVGYNFWLNQGADGWYKSAVVSSVFGAGVTTVQIADAIVTNNLVDIWRDYVVDGVNDRAVLTYGNLQHFNNVEVSTLRVGQDSFIGTTLDRIVKGTAEINPGSLPANATLDVNFTMSGVTSDMWINLKGPAGLDSGIGIVGAYYVSTDVAAARFINATIGIIDPATGTYYYMGVK